MLRKLVCAVAILGFSLGLAVAGELKGKITKIDGSSLTFQAIKDKKPDGDPQVLDVAKDAKVYKGGKKDKTELADGLKSPDLSSIPEKGVNAMVTVDDTSKKVTEIVIFTGKKKKE